MTDGTETTTPAPQRASDEDWCERAPVYGHAWTYFHHAGEPPIETRKCVLCDYPSAQPIREQIARLTAENARLRQQRDAAQAELAEIGKTIARFDFGGSYVFQVSQLVATLDAAVDENVRLGGELGSAEIWADGVCAEFGIEPDEDTHGHRLGAIWNRIRALAAPPVLAPDTEVMLPAGSQRRWVVRDVWAPAGFAGPFVEVRLIPAGDETAPEGPTPPLSATQSPESAPVDAPSTVTPEPSETATEDARGQQEWCSCGMHNEHCEPPSELCCEWCTEVIHPNHHDGSVCVLAPAPQLDPSWVVGDQVIGEAAPRFDFEDKLAESEARLADSGVQVLGDQPVDNAKSAPVDTLGMAVEISEPIRNGYRWMRILREGLTERGITTSQWARTAPAALAAIDSLRSEVESLTAEAEASRTWRGVMALVDRYYPTTIFPVEDDHPGSDDGPRILSLIRHLDEARALAARLTTERDEAQCDLEVADEERQDAVAAIIALREGVRAIGTDLANDSPDRLPISPRKVGIALLNLLSPSPPDTQEQSND